VLIETTRSGLRDGLEAARAEGKRIALVPTMGYLHEGHLSLVDHALRVSDVVVMSIFVNPLQFGPSEDLARYPRDLVRDSELAQKRGVDMIFAPSDEEMYEAGRPVVTIIAHAAAQRMEGEFRPGHFEGVLTVVAKLFNIVQPHVSIFGQKDFQQSVLIKRMCTDLDFPIRIDVAPTVREPDGLALSSRNVYLSASDRALSGFHVRCALPKTFTPMANVIRTLCSRQRALCSRRMRRYTFNTSISSIRVRSSNRQKCRLTV
jgi:pantoate--beta-alanine ligase